VTIPDDPTPRAARTTPPNGHAAAERDTSAFENAFTEGGGSTVAESGGLHRLLVDSVRDYAIFALDPAGYILSWNAGAERLKGYTPDEIIGRHFSIFYPPGDIVVDKPGRMLADAIRDGRVEDEGWRIRRDGSRFWADVVITALRDESGALVGFAKVTRDLSERRRAEERLRESEERFRLIVQGVRDYAIFMLDLEGRVASWNEGAERINGYAPEEIVGRHFSTFYPAADVAAGKPKWELEVAMRDGKYEEEGWRVRKDGTPFWSNVLITALRGPDGQLLGYAKVTRDLTERLAAQERALADARRLAETEATSRAKSEFLTAMSHELRTPINATLGYVELIELGIGGPTSEQQRDYLQRIRGSQEHLLGIVTDLLNYGRMQAGQMTYELGPVPVHAVVESALRTLEAQASSKGITVDHGPCPRGLVARADRAKVTQIVFNLISNAVKFTPAEGRVTVGCGGTTGTVAITVTDTGPGVPTEKQGAIFEPFVQLGRSFSSGHEGTGLGLAISRDLARAMGGDIAVESRVGSGSIFTLSLPRATA